MPETVKEPLTTLPADREGNLIKWVVHERIGSQIRLPGSEAPVFKYDIKDGDLILCPTFSGYAEATVTMKNGATGAETAHTLFVLAYEEDRGWVSVGMINKKCLDKLSVFTLDAENQTRKMPWQQLAAKLSHIMREMSGKAVHVLPACTIGELGFSIWYNDEWGKEIAWNPCTKVSDKQVLVRLTEQLVSIMRELSGREVQGVAVYHPEDLGYGFSFWYVENGHDHSFFATVKSDKGAYELVSR